jgi:hypothetical protein
MKENQFTKESVAALITYIMACKVYEEISKNLPDDKFPSDKHRFEALDKLNKYFDLQTIDTFIMYRAEYEKILGIK